MKILKFTFVIALSLFSELLLASNQPQNLNSECKDFIKTIENRYVYNWVQVFETPASTDTISVFYYYRKNSTLKDPVLFLNGGPGYTSHGLEGTFEINKIKMSAGKNIDIDYIFMDQRGNGCSTPFPVGVSFETIEKLKWYGSAGMVNDAEEIRKKLIGSRKWKIFGQSYGAHVVHRYIQMYPQSIAKAYAHGYTEGPTDFDFLFARIGTQVRVLESYLKKNPEDRHRLEVLNQYLANPAACFMQKQKRYCGFEILTPLVYLLAFRDSWDALHTALLQLVPDSVVDVQGMKKYVEDMSSTTSTYNNITPTVEANLHNQSVALNFLGIYDTDNSPMELKQCQAVYEKLQQDYNIKPNQRLLDECKAPVQYQYQDRLGAILRTKVNPTEIRYLKVDEIKSNLAKYKIPFYLYSGGLDCLIPKELFQAEVKALGKLVHYTNFPESGHEGFLTESKILHDLNN